MVTDPSKVPGMRLTWADALTLGNATCGFLAVYFVATSVINQLLGGGSVILDRSSFATAVVLLLFAATFDVLDGFVARRFGGSRMGGDLDNLADVISFGFAPAFMVAAWAGFAPDHRHPLALVAAAAVLVGGVVRLARFAVTPPEEKCEGFQGLPIPMAAMTVVSIVLLNPPIEAGLLGVLVVAYLMVSRIEYPKPSGKLMYVVLAWIAVNVACLSIWAFNLPGGEVLITAGAGMQVALVGGVPFLMVKAHRATRREIRQEEERRTGVPAPRFSDRLGERFGGGGHPERIRRWRRIPATALRARPHVSLRRPGGLRVRPRRRR